MVINSGSFFSIVSALFYRYVISPNGSLTLRNVGLQDSGIYQCMVENKAGSDIDRTYFQLNSKCHSFQDVGEV